MVLIGLQDLIFSMSRNSCNINFSHNIGTVWFTSTTHMESQIVQYSALSDAILDFLWQFFADYSGVFYHCNALMNYSGKISWCSEHYLLKQLFTEVYKERFLVFHLVLVLL